jgi:hypothetical protein
LALSLFHAGFRLSEESGIPLVVENVKGAQKYVGRARWHYGSFYLWGDVPAMMPFASGRQSFAPTASWFGDYEAQKQTEDGAKVGGDYFSGELRIRNPRRYSSKSSARKAASAQIAKIPLPLSRHIAQVYKPC